MVSEISGPTGASAPAPASPARRPHPFYEGEYLDPDPKPERRIAHETDSAAVAAPPAAPGRVAHPFYEGEYLDPDAGARAFGADGPSFLDLLDILNPLQHIPVVSAIYRRVTGDEISPMARIAGGLLYGGPVGLATAFANGLLEETTGRDLGGTVLAFLAGEEEGDLEPPTELAELAPAAGPKAAASGTPAPPAPEATRPPSATLAPSVPQTPEPSEAGAPISLLPRDPSARERKSARLGAAAAPDPAAPSNAEREIAQREVVIGASAAAGSGGGAPRSGPRSLRGPSGGAIMEDPIRAMLLARGAVPQALVPQAPGSVVATRRGAGRQIASAAMRHDIGADPEDRVPGKRGVPPPRGTAPSATSERRRPQAAAMPAGYVAQQMMKALAKYEAMMKRRTASNDSNDLTL